MFGFPPELAYSVCLELSLLLHPGPSAFTPVAEKENREEFPCFPHLPLDPFWDCSVMWCYENRKGISVPVFPFSRAAKIQFVQKHLVNTFQKLRWLDFLKLLSQEWSSDHSDFIVVYKCYLLELILFI